MIRDAHKVSNAPAVAQTFLSAVSPTFLSASRSTGTSALDVANGPQVGKPAIQQTGMSALRARAFSLIELLVVIVIIGILASITLPAMKGISKANLTAATTRQILDDLSFARLRAMNERTTVFMVFVPPNVLNRLDQEPANSPDRRILTNLIGNQFTGYALLSARTVGDQPGQSTPRYLTDWKSLPDGMLFAPYKFKLGLHNHPSEYIRTFATNAFPFPDSGSGLFSLPYIGFNSQGQLISQRDEILTLARGSVFYARDAQGKYARAVADVQLTPPPNDAASPQTQTNTYEFVRINWLTGRAQMDPATTAGFK